MPSDISPIEEALESASRLSILVNRTVAARVARLLAERAFAQLTAQDLVAAGLQDRDVPLVELELSHLRTRDARLVFYGGLISLTNGTDSAEIELCWTGPRGRIALRSTGPVIEEMIHAALRRIVIAEFDVTEAALPILKMVGERARSGVEVFFLVDRAEEKQALIDWAKGTPGIELWSSRTPSEDRLAKFHVKSVLVDGKVGMFGSANLTRHGLRGNVELGILVRNPRIVQRAEDALLESRSDMTLVVPRP